MKQMYEDNGFKFFLRDADNILEAECVVLIGTREHPQGLNCGYCGYAACGEREDGVPCAINSVDLGIALGSACSVAADHRVDTRIMFSAGLAARQLDWLNGCTQVYAIPVSASSKIRFLTVSLNQNKFFYDMGNASSSLERVMKSAFSFTTSCALAMATPSPAYWIIERSLNPSPTAIISSLVIPSFSRSTEREQALSMPFGTSSRK